MNTTAAALVPSPTQELTLYGVGASMAAAAIGVSEYKSPIDAWLEATKRSKPFEGNEQTMWGRALEPLIRAHYVERHHVAVHVPPTSLFHRDLPFVRATPDGIVLGPNNEWLYVAPQVKNVGLRQATHWEDGNTPTHYLIQGVVEMAVCDLPRIDFAVLIGGQQYREVTIERDRDLEGEVLEGLAAFWQLVESDTQPVVDESRSYKSFLLKQARRRVTVTATEDAAKHIERWRELARSIKQQKLEEQRVKNLVLAELVASEASTMVSDFGNITIGAKPRVRTKWRSVADDMQPLVSTLQILELELLSLRAVADESIAKRIDGLLAQLQLASGPPTYDEIVARHSRAGDPSFNRPRDWTKGIGLDDLENDNDNDNEEH